MTTFTDARKDTRASATSRAGTFILSINHDDRTVAVSHNLQFLSIPKHDRLRTFADLFAYSTSDDAEAALTANFHTEFRSLVGSKADDDLVTAFREGYRVLIVSVWHEPVIPPADAGGDALRRLLATAPTAATPATSSTQKFLAALRDTATEAGA